MFSPKGEDLPRGWPGRIDGDRVIQLAAQTLQAFFTGGGVAREHAEYALADVDLRPPVIHPPAARLFKAQSLDFEFLNTASIYGPEDEIPFPQGASSIEPRLGLAAVIGAEGEIGGYTLANVFVAPELAGAKQRDFALSLGPVVVTDLAPVLDPAWDELVAHAALNTRLRPGDLLIVDGGPAGDGLRPGDTAQVETAEIGVLRNTIV
ncbi:MAG TPA: fumarylacetoacetate hydrolase family protein [Gaiellaceae bacterium]|nr:fumarylacetoacetate hydrolase family protein [Gaiellaceae bacterium]